MNQAREKEAEDMQTGSIADSDREGAVQQFALSSEQESVRGLALDFAREQLAPHAIEWDQRKYFPIEAIRHSAELGMGGIYVRESSGGSGMTRFDAALIFESLATGCPSTAAYISIHNMVAWMIDNFGSDEQRERWVRGLCSTELLGSYCLTEASVGSDAAALSTKAVRSGDDYVLTGIKQFVSGGGVADVYIVMARTGEAGPRGISAFVVEKGTRGLSYGPPEKKMGWNTQPTCQVILDEVRVPAANLLGPEGHGFKIAMSGLDGGRLNIGACSLGGGRAALDKATRYMFERKAFGKRLAEFEALQFRVADMATQLEVARTFLWRAAASLDAKRPDATKLCAMAKRFATDVGFQVANDSLQLHGGYGYLSEYGIEKIVRDLRVHQILEGTNEIMRLIIARSVLGEGR